MCIYFCAALFFSPGWAHEIFTDGCLNVDSTAKTKRDQQDVVENQLPVSYGRYYMIPKSTNNSLRETSERLSGASLSQLITNGLSGNYKSAQTQTCCWVSQLWCCFVDFEGQDSKFKPLAIRVITFSLLLNTKSHLKNIFSHSPFADKKIPFFGFILNS